MRSLLWEVYSSVDILPALEDEDSCSWFSDSTYQLKLPFIGRGAYLPKRFPKRYAPLTRVRGSSPMPLGTVLPFHPQNA